MDLNKWNERKAKLATMAARGGSEAERELAKERLEGMEQKVPLNGGAGQEFVLDPEEQERLDRENWVLFMQVEAEEIRRQARWEREQATRAEAWTIRQEKAAELARKALEARMEKLAEAVREYAYGPVKPVMNGSKWWEMAAKWLRDRLGGA